MDRKFFFKLIPVLVLALALPVGINLLGNTAIFRSQASGEPIVFKVDGTNVVERNGQKVAIGAKPKVNVILTSPIGPAGVVASPSPSSSATPSPAETPTGTPTSTPGATPPPTTSKEDLLWPKLTQFFNNIGGINSAKAQAVPTLNSCTVTRTTVNVGDSITYTMNGDPGGYVGQISYGWEHIPAIPDGPIFQQTVANNQPTISGAYQAAGTGRLRAVLYYSNQAVKKDCPFVTVLAATPAPTATATPGPGACTLFTMSGIGVTENAAVGGKSYNVPNSGGTFELRANNQGSGFSATVTGTPTASITSSTSGSSTLINIPANTGTTQPTYSINARLSTGAACDTITVKVGATSSEAPAVCTNFYLQGSGLVEDGTVNGGKAYKMPSTGGEITIKADNLTPDKFTPSSTSPGLADAIRKNNNQTNWIMNVPANTSNTETTTYTIDGSITAGGACNPITLRVQPQSTNVCNYQETIIKFQKEGSSSWDLNGEIAKGQSIKIAAFHKEKNSSVFSSTPATDVNFTFIGPNGDGTIPNISGIATFSPSENITAATNFTINVATENQSATGCASTKTLVVKPATFVTNFYKIAESPDKLAGAPLIPYTAEGLIKEFEFSDSAIGQKFVFVEFIGTGTDGTEKKEQKSAHIEYVGPDPKIKGVACTTQVSGTGVVIKIEGENLGAASDKASISVNGSSAEVLGEWSNTGMNARFSGAASSDGKYSVVVTRGDGQAAKASCQVGASILSIEPKVSCLTQTNILGGKSADITIIDSSGNAFKEKVTLGSDGSISGLKAKLQPKQRYRIYLKVAGSLRRSQEFTASEGTTVLSNFNLPLGDLNTDGRINSADYRLLLSAWRLGRSNSSTTSGSSTLATANPTASALGTATPRPTTAATTAPTATANPAGTGATGGNRAVLAETFTFDLNDDGAVNSFDLACMRGSFNQSDDVENTNPPSLEQPATAVTPTPTASASATLAPTASPSTAPTIAATTAPTTAP